MNLEGIFVRLGNASTAGNQYTRLTMVFEVPHSEELCEVRVSPEIALDLGASQRETRQRVADAGLELLREAVRLLEQHSVEGLEQVALGQQERHAQAVEQKLLDSISNAPKSIDSSYQSPLDSAISKGGISGE